MALNQQVRRVPMDISTRCAGGMDAAELHALKKGCFEKGDGILCLLYSVHVYEILSSGF